MLLLAAAVLSVQATGPTAALPWFTEAEIAGAVRLEVPADPLPSTRGTAGKGVSLVREHPIENSLLSSEQGLISFWIRPAWNGDDGKRHVFLKLGDPTRNGILVEKAESGMLRYVMASPAAVTVGRTDVSHWRKGEWHQIAIGWYRNEEGKPLGLPLWVDKVAKDGRIAGHNTFFDPSSMTDRRIIIGDSTSDAEMDELIFRGKLYEKHPPDQIETIYRDWFRTAPFSAISVDHEPSCVPADRRVLAGHQKQFGLKARLPSGFVRITDFAVRYGQWSEFDAKPFIRWGIDKPEIATVDENGLVTGHRVGRCRLTAEFRWMRASYDVEVIPEEQPDLVVLWVELLPRYPWDEAKDRPAPGESVESVVHIANYGFAASAPGVFVRFELLPDANQNFKLDKGERASEVALKTIGSLSPRQETIVRFPWKWREEPTWVRVTVDSTSASPDLCLPNNTRCDLNTARPLRMAFPPKVREDTYRDKRINLVGSFCYYDWVHAEVQRLQVMMREAVYPTTSPDGIRDAVRIDNFYDLQLGEWEKEPWVLNERYYDGGFPINELVDPMAIDSAIIHEFGHTCLALPDLYGYPVRAWNVLLKDEQGNPYGGGPLLPVVGADGIITFSTANNVPCGVGYTPLMDYCHLWLHPAHAGQVQYFAGFRGSRFWGTQGRLIPWREHFLQVYDFEDKPLVGAAVYVYHVTQTDAQDATTKFFADRPKFMGNTDKDGRYKFPETTDASWDDPDTDLVEGAWPVWNPFGRAKTTTGAPPDTAFTPNVWTVEGLLLIKVVCGDQVEFAWLPLTELNEAFFRGERIRGVYPIRTSLRPVGQTTQLVRTEVPEAIREVNTRPVAVAPAEITVRCGEAFEIDASESRDPEGQPLYYRWVRSAGTAGPAFGMETKLRGKAPEEPGETEYKLLVIDGLRVSEPVSVRLQFVKGD